MERHIRFTSVLLLSALAVGESYAQVNAQDNVSIRRSRSTGLIRSVTPANGKVLVTTPRPGKLSARQCLTDYASVLGIEDVQNQLELRRTRTDALGHSHSTFDQYHNGIRVFSGELRVHQAGGDLLAINGSFLPVSPKLNVRPEVSEQTAAQIANGHFLSDSTVIRNLELVVVDPAWYGDPPKGVRLAYYVILDNQIGSRRHAFLIDAHRGTLLDAWNMIHTARDRQVYDGGGGTSLPGSLARSEGDGPVVNPADADLAYDYLGDTYDYFSRAFGRDGIDGLGMPMAATVNSTTASCPNAFWSSQWQQVVFCLGTAEDDIVAHEVVHGITEHTAGLIYQNQSGQLNEAFSDIFGELVDLFNGDAAFVGAIGGPPNWPVHPSGPGLDSPNNARFSCSFAPTYSNGVRWLVGEDAIPFGGAIRDMWDPACEGDPSFASSSLQICSVFDNGGVHSGSGIMNHAFVIATDGKAFNGYTVSGLGPIKTGAVWYRALTTYLTAGSDFEDAYWALNQSAADLVGTDPLDPRTGVASGDPVTAQDVMEIDKALLAVELDSPGRCGQSEQVLNGDIAPECSAQSMVYAEDFEAGIGSWTVTNTGPPTPYDWVSVSALPHGRNGMAAFCSDPVTTCSEVGGPPGATDESAAHYLDSPPIQLPANVNFPVLAFDHYMESEPFWDGGNVSISVDGGIWTLVPASAFYYNAYNLGIPTAAQGNSNPLESQAAFSGTGGAWGTSLAHLGGFVSGGEEIRLRFSFGKDRCNGEDGWYVDDVRIYDCTNTADCNNNSLPDDIELSSSGQADTLLIRPSSHGQAFQSDKDGIGGGQFSFAQRLVLLSPKTLHTIKIWGVYSPIDFLLTDDFTVVIHTEDQSSGVGLPGTAIALQPSVIFAKALSGEVVQGRLEWMISLDLQPIALGPGPYWLEVFNNTAADNAGFFWTASEYSSGPPQSAFSFSAPGQVWFEGNYSMSMEVLGDPIGSDCNENSTPDDCDIAQAISDDCNVNAIPDDCELADGTSLDCNVNLVLDECDIASGSSTDCNLDAIPDDCEPFADCNGNTQRDICDIFDGTSLDCEGNGIPDECEPDCNANTVADPCDIIQGTSVDCDQNFVPDECEADCNANEVVDACDVAPIEFEIGPDGVLIPPKSAPWRAVHANINGDMYPDLVAAVSNRLYISVFLNNGDGTFGAETIVNLDNDRARVVVATDLDNDGDDDVVVALHDTFAIAVLINDGGVLGAPIEFSTPANPYFMAADDLDGDTFVDMIVPVEVGLAVSILINNGIDGGGQWLGFSAPVEYPTSTYTYAAVTGDWNNDLAPDVAVTHEFSDEVSILINNGDGTFGAPFNVETSDPLFITAADFDQDGDDDIAVANRDDDTVWVLLNFGDGLFVPVDILQVDTPWWITAGDLNGDTFADLSVASDNGELTVLLNDGRAFFSQAINMAAGEDSRSIVLADTDLDGDNDLVVTNDGGGIESNLAFFANLTTGGGQDCNGNLVPDACDIATGTSLDTDNDGVPDECVLDCDGDGVPDDLEPDCNKNGFADVCETLSGVPDCDANEVPDECEVATGAVGWLEATLLNVPITPVDFSIGSYVGDSRLDLAAIGEVAKSLTVFGDFSGHGFDPQLPTTFQDLVRNIESADFNLDGHDDVALGLSGPATLVVQLNDGNGNFSTAFQYSGYVPQAPTVGDLDLDGDEDLVFGVTTGPAAIVLFNQGVDSEGQWLGLGSAMNLGSGNDARDIVLHDLTGDDLPEIIVAERGQDEISVFVNLGAGSFGSEASYSSVTQLEALAAGDFNGDQLQDVVTGRAGSGAIRLRPGDGTGALGSANVILENLTVFGLRAGDIDQNGTLDLVCADGLTDSVIVLLGQGNGQFLVHSYLPAGDRLQEIALEDLDFDGDLDIAVASRDSHEVRVFLNQFLNPHDCNENAVPDACDILAATSVDCDANGRPDECEPDCNSNTITDACDIRDCPPEDPACQDCNTNTIPDSCDIAVGTSLDENGNGTPDECDCPTLTALQIETLPIAGNPPNSKNRVVSVIPVNSGLQIALRVSFDNLPAPFDTLIGETMWLGEVVEYCHNSGQGTPPPGGCAEAPGAPGLSYFAASLECDPFYTDWTEIGPIHIYDELVIPGAVYSVQAIDQRCDTANETQYSPQATIGTSIWGDITESCASSPCLPPDQSIDITTDVTAVLDTFKNLASALAKTRADLEPEILDHLINISDVTVCLDAFRGESYPFLPGPDPCP